MIKIYQDDWKEEADKQENLDCESELIMDDIMLFYLILKSLLQYF